MTAFLPPNLLALFAPRDPISYLPPIDKLPWEKKHMSYTGISNFVDLFEDPKDTPPPTRSETRDERKERRRREKAEMVAYKLEQDLALWDPSTDPNTSDDPYKTLFVARINFDTSESKLRREFESHGPIRKVNMVFDKISGKPRGYAFLEYEHERDMHSAYKHGDGKKIDGRRVLVDVERGRTVKGWRPRRLGGGLGGARRMADRTQEDRDRDRERSRGGRAESRADSRAISRDRRGAGDRESERSSRRPPTERRRSRSRDRAAPSSRAERKRDERPRDDKDRGKEAEKSSRRDRESRSDRDRGGERRRSRDRDAGRSRRRSRSRDRKRGDKDVKSELIGPQMPSASAYGPPVNGTPYDKDGNYVGDYGLSNGDAHNVVVKQETNESEAVAAKE